jgi:uncharacterized membrane protein YeiH
VTADPPPGERDSQRARRLDAERVVMGIDLAATLVFALEGGLAAVDADIDVLGVLVVAFATALAGGIIRDLLIGAVPPASIEHPRYALTAFTAGLAVIVLYTTIEQVPEGVLTTLDAAGLALFAVAGAEKALLWGINPLSAVLLGGVTAVGGGSVRDILLNDVPAVLRTQVYALAALLGAAVLVIGLRRGLPRGPMMLAGAAVCFLVRMLSVWLDWNLPTVR